MDLESFYLDNNKEPWQTVLGLAESLDTEEDLLNLFGQKNDFDLNYLNLNDVVKHSNAAEPEPDLLVAGCSFTRGAGLDNYQDAWGARLASSLKTDYVNISQDGMSADLIAIYVTSYIYRSKNKPKYIAILFPDLLRFCSLEGSDNYAADLVVKNISDRKDYPYLPAKYSKSPHDIEQVITTENAIHTALRSMSILIQQCELLGIQLVWGTWDFFSNKLYKSVFNLNSKVVLGNYVDLPFYTRAGSHLVPSLPETCHLENSHSGHFTMGNDDGAHAGVHYHIHWAEAFYASLNK